MSSTATQPKLYERMPVDEITAQARTVRPGRVLVGVIAACLWMVGFATAKLFGVLWFAGVWAAVAVRTGWREARGEPLNQPRLEEVMAENERLRAELARVT